jgi:hypothetical protein
MNRDSWWGRQLQREDVITSVEQGRRVEVELFQEKHRGLRTMGELLKARMFGATEYAINLRKRMTNYVQGAGAPSAMPRRGEGDQHWLSPSPRIERPGGGSHQEPIGARPIPPPEPHQWPCQDPFCDPCDEATKRLLRDLNLLPRGNRGIDYTAEPISGRLKVPARYRKDESDK